MRFMPGTAIYRIADFVHGLGDRRCLRRIWPGEGRRMAWSQSGSISGPDLRGQAYHLPTLNAATQTTVRLELANRDGLLRPGMFVHVDIASAGSAIAFDCAQIGAHRHR